MKDILVEDFLKLYGSEETTNPVEESDNNTNIESADGESVPAVPNNVPVSNVETEPTVPIEEQQPVSDTIPETVPGIKEPDPKQTRAIYDKIYGEEATDEGFAQFNQDLRKVSKAYGLYEKATEAGAFSGSLEAFWKWTQGQDTLSDYDKITFTYENPEISVEEADILARDRARRDLDISTRINEKQKDLDNQRIEQQNKMVGAVYADYARLKEQYKGLRLTAINAALVYDPASLQDNAGAIEDITPEVLTKLKSGTQYETSMRVAKTASKWTGVNMFIGAMRAGITGMLKGKGSWFEGQQAFKRAKDASKALPEVIEGDAKQAALVDYLNLASERANVLTKKITDLYPDAEERLTWLEEFTKKAEEQSLTEEDIQEYNEGGYNAWFTRYRNDPVVDKYYRLKENYDKYRGELESLGDKYPLRQKILNLKMSDQLTYDAWYRDLPGYQKTLVNVVEKLSLFFEKPVEMVMDAPFVLSSIFGFGESQLSMMAQMDDLSTVDPVPSNAKRDIYENVGYFKRDGREYQVVVDDEGEVSNVRDSEGYPVHFLLPGQYESFVADFKKSGTPVKEQFNGGAFASVLGTIGTDFFITIGMMRLPIADRILKVNSIVNSERMLSAIIPTLQYAPQMSIDAVKMGMNPQAASIYGTWGAMTEGLSEAVNPFEARFARGMKLNKAGVARVMNLDIPNWQKGIMGFKYALGQTALEMGEEYLANGLNSVTNKVAYENFGVLPLKDHAGWENFKKEIRPTFWLTLGLMGPVSVYHSIKNWSFAETDDAYHYYTFNAVQDPKRFIKISEQIRNELGKNNIVQRKAPAGEERATVAELSDIITKEQEIITELNSELRVLLDDTEISENDKTRVTSMGHTIKNNERLIAELPEGPIRTLLEATLAPIKQRYNNLIEELLKNKGKKTEERTYTPPEEDETIEVNTFEDQPFFDFDEVKDELDLVETIKTEAGEDVNIFLDKFGNEYYGIPYDGKTVIVDAEKYTQWQEADQETSERLNSTTDASEIDDIREKGNEKKRMIIGDMTSDEIADINERNSFVVGNEVTFDNGEKATVLEVHKRGKGISKVVLDTEKGRVTLNNAKQVRAANAKLRKYAPTNTRGINSNGLSDSISDNVGKMNRIVRDDAVSNDRKNNIARHVARKLKERDFDSTVRKARSLQSNGIIKNSGSIGSTAVVLGSDGVYYGHTTDGWRPIESSGPGGSIVYGNKDTRVSQILNKELNYNPDSDAIVSNDFLALSHYVGLEEIQDVTPLQDVDDSAIGEYISFGDLVHEQDGYKLYRLDSGTTYLVDPDGNLVPTDKAEEILDSFGQTFLPDEVTNIMSEAMGEQNDSDQIDRELQEILGEDSPGPWTFNASHTDTSILPDSKVGKNLKQQIKNVIKAFTNVMPDITIKVYTNRSWKRRDAAYFDKKNNTIHINVDVAQEGVFAHEVIHPILLSMLHNSPDLYFKMEEDIYDAFLSAKIPSLEEFMSHYANKNKKTQRHEALTEFLKQVVTGELKLEGEEAKGLNRAIRKIIDAFVKLFGKAFTKVFNIDDLESSRDVVITANLIRDVLDGAVILDANFRVNTQDEEHTTPVSDIVDDEPPMRGPEPPVSEPIPPAEPKLQKSRPQGVLSEGLRSDLMDALHKAFPDVTITIYDDITTVPGGTEIKNANGDVLGFTLGKQIYLNGEFLNENTAIHEYGHVMLSMVRLSRPELWRAIKKAIAVTNYYTQAKKDYSELANEDDIYEEAFVTLLGDYGAGNWETILKQAGQDHTLLGRIKAFIQEIMGIIARGFGITDYNAEVIASMTLREMLGGRKAFSVSLREFFGKVDTKHLEEAEKILDRGFSLTSDVGTVVEMAQINDATKSRKEFMRAPNGKKTKLSEHEWLFTRTDEYALRHGEFDNKEWPKGVVDKNGEPTLQPVRHPVKLAKIKNEKLFKWLRANLNIEGVPTLEVHKKLIDAGFDSFEFEDSQIPFIIHLANLFYPDGGETDTRVYPEFNMDDFEKTTGGKLIHIESVDDLLKYEKYYGKNRLCTFNNPKGRMSNYDIWVFVKDGMENMTPKDNPSRYDEYSTSLLMIQRAKDHWSGDDYIISRYNHAVDKPNYLYDGATFDSFYPGLGKYLGQRRKKKTRSSGDNNYRIHNGKIYKFEGEVDGNSIFYNKRGILYNNLPHQINPDYQTYLGDGYVHDNREKSIYHVIGGVLLQGPGLKKDASGRGWETTDGQKYIPSEILVSNIEISNHIIEVTEARLPNLKEAHTLSAGIAYLPNLVNVVANGILTIDEAVLHPSWYDGTASIAGSITIRGANNIRVREIFGNVSVYNYSTLNAGTIGGTAISNDKSTITAESIEGRATSYEESTITAESIGGDATSRGESTLNAGTIGRNATSSDKSTLNAGTIEGFAISYGESTLTAESIGGDATSHGESTLNAGTIERFAISEGESTINAGTIGRGATSNDKSTITAESIGRTAISHGESTLNAESIGENAISEGESTLNAGTIGGDATSYYKSTLTAGTIGGDAISSAASTLTAESIGRNAISTVESTLTAESIGGNATSYAASTLNAGTIGKFASSTDKSTLNAVTVGDSAYSNGESTLNAESIVGSAHSNDKSTLTAESIGENAYSSDKSTLNAGTIGGFAISEGESTLTAGTIEGFADSRDKSTITAESIEGDATSSNESTLTAETIGGNTRSYGQSTLTAETIEGDATSSNESTLTAKRVEENVTDSSQSIITDDMIEDELSYDSLTPDGIEVINHIEKMFQNEENRFGTFNNFRNRLSELQETPNKATPYLSNYTREQAVEHIIKNGVPEKGLPDKIYPLEAIADSYKNELSSFVGERGLRWRYPVSRSIYDTAATFSDSANDRKIFVYAPIILNTAEIEENASVRLEDIINIDSSVGYIPHIFAIYPWLRQVTVSFANIEHSGHTVPQATFTDVRDSILFDYYNEYETEIPDTYTEEELRNIITDAFVSEEGFRKFEEVFGGMGVYSPHYLFDKMDEFAEDTEIVISNRVLQSPMSQSTREGIIMDIVMHEVQHLIQFWEGWDGGGSPEAIARILQDEHTLFNYKNSLTVLSDVLTVLQEGYTGKITVPGINNKEYYIEIPENKLDRFNIVMQLGQVSDNTSNAYKLYSTEWGRNFLKQFPEFSGKLSAETSSLYGISYQLYRHLAGEVQANQVGALYSHMINTEQYIDDLETISQKQHPIMFLDTSEDWFADNYQLGRTFTKEEISKAAPKIYKGPSQVLESVIQDIDALWGRLSSESNKEGSKKLYAVYQDVTSKRPAIVTEKMLNASMRANRIVNMTFGAAQADQSRMWDDTEELPTELSSYGTADNRMFSPGLDFSLTGGYRTPKKFKVVSRATGNSVLADNVGSPKKLSTIIQNREYFPNNRIWNAVRSRADLPVLMNTDVVLADIEGADGFYFTGLVSTELGKQPPRVVVDRSLPKQEFNVVLQHEVIHAYTYGVISLYSTNKSILSEKERKFVEDMQAMYETYNKSGADYYGLSNLHEFVSEGLTNKEFMRFLDSKTWSNYTDGQKEVTVPITYTGLDKFLNSIFKLFGLEYKPAYKKEVATVREYKYKGVRGSNIVGQSFVDFILNKSGNVWYDRSKGEYYFSLKGDIDSELSSYKIPDNRVTSLGLNPNIVSDQWLSRLIDDFGWLNNVKPTDKHNKREAVRNAAIELFKDVYQQHVLNDYDEPELPTGLSGNEDFRHKFIKLVNRLTSNFIQLQINILNESPDMLDDQYEMLDILRTLENAKSFAIYLESGSSEPSPGAENSLDYNHIMGEYRHLQIASLNRYLEYYNNILTAAEEDINQAIFGLHLISQVAAYDVIFVGNNIKINKRSPTYTKPFEEFNAEAARLIYDEGPTNEPLIKRYVEKKIEIANKKIESYSATVYHNTENGAWYKFTSVDDSEYVSELGTGTGWCTASKDTAKDYLRRGNIAIFVKRGKPVIQLHYTDDSIFEAGGLEPGQQLTTEDNDDLTEFLTHENHSGAETYRLKKWIARLNNDSQEPVPKDIRDKIVDTFSSDENPYMPVEDFFKRSSQFRDMISEYHNIPLNKIKAGSDLSATESNEDVELVIGDIGIRNRIKGGYLPVHPSLGNVKKVIGVVHLNKEYDLSNLEYAEGIHLIRDSADQTYHLPKLKEIAGYLEAYSWDNNRIYIDAPSLEFIGDVRIGSAIQSQNIFMILDVPSLKEIGRLEPLLFARIIAPSLEKVHRKMSLPGNVRPSEIITNLKRSDIATSNYPSDQLSIIPVSEYNKNAELDELSSIPGEDNERVNKALAKIREETDPNKREAMLEAASIAFNIPYDDLERRARDFASTDSVRRKINKALNAVAPYMNSYPGVTINAVKNSVIKKLREEGVTEEQFPDSSVEAMVTESVLSRENARPDVSEKEKRYLRKIAAEVGPDNSVMDVVAKYRSRYRRNYKRELPWQYVKELSEGMDPFTTRKKVSKTAKRKGLDDITKQILETISVEERTDVEQARLVDQIWGQLLETTGNDPIATAKAVLNSWEKVRDPATANLLLGKASMTAFSYGEMGLKYELDAARVRALSAQGRALRTGKGIDGLSYRIVDDFWDDLDRKLGEAYDSEINGRKVRDIIQELLGLQFEFARTRADIARTVRGLIESLSGGLSSELAHELFFNINDLLTVAEQALPLADMQMVVRDKLLRAARSYHLRAGKKVKDKPAYDKILDAYVRNQGVSKIGRASDIKKALESLITDLTGPDWLVAVNNSIRVAGTLLEASSPSYKDKMLALAYAEHVRDQLNGITPTTTAIDNIDPALEIAIVDALNELYSGRILTTNVYAYLMGRVPGITPYKARLVADHMAETYYPTLGPSEKKIIRDRIEKIVGKGNSILGERLFRKFASGEITEPAFSAVLADHLGLLVLDPSEREQYGKLLTDIMTSRNAKDLSQAYTNLALFTDSLAAKHGIEFSKSINDALDRVIGHGYNAMLSGVQTWQRAFLSAWIEQLGKMALDVFGGTTGLLGFDLVWSKVAIQAIREYISGAGLSAIERIVYSGDLFYRIVVNDEPMEFKFDRDWDMQTNALDIKRAKMAHNWGVMLDYIKQLITGHFDNPMTFIKKMKTTRIPILSKEMSGSKFGKASEVPMTVFDMLMYPILKPLVYGTRMIKWTDAMFMSFTDYEIGVTEMQQAVLGGELIENVIAARNLARAADIAAIDAQVRAEGLTGVKAVRRKKELWMSTRNSDSFNRAVHTLEVVSLATHTHGLMGKATVALENMTMSKSGSAFGKLLRMAMMQVVPFAKVVGGGMRLMFRSTPIIGNAGILLFKAATGSYRTRGLRPATYGKVLEYDRDTRRHVWREMTPLESNRDWNRALVAMFSVALLMSYLFDFDDDDKDGVIRMVPSEDSPIRITGFGTGSFGKDAKIDKGYSSTSVQMKYNDKWHTLLDYSIIPSLAPVCILAGSAYDRYALIADRFDKGYRVALVTYDQDVISDRYWNYDIADITGQLAYAWTHVAFETSVAKGIRNITDFIGEVMDKPGTTSQIKDENELARARNTTSRILGNMTSQYLKPSLYKQILAYYRQEHMVPLPAFSSGNVVSGVIENNMRTVVGLNLFANSLYGDGRMLKDEFGVPIIPEQDFFVVGGTKNDFALPTDWEKRSYGEYLLRRAELTPFYEHIYANTDINAFTKYYPQMDIEGSLETIPADVVDEISDVASIRIGYMLMDKELQKQLMALNATELLDYYDKKLKKRAGDEAKAIVFQKYLNAIDPTFLEDAEEGPMGFKAIKAALGNAGFDILTEEQVEAGEISRIAFAPDGTFLVGKNAQKFLKEKHPALYQWAVVDRKPFQDAIELVTDMDLLDWATWSDEDKEKRKSMLEHYRRASNH